MIFRKSQSSEVSLQAGFSSRQLLLARLEEVNLELSTLSEEREELQRLLNQFDAAYHTRLGKYISRILELRRERASKLAQDDVSFGNRYQEAVDDYNSWHQTTAELSQKKIFSLSDEDTNLLKQAFRKAARKCHPDVTSSNDKEKSQKLFVSLRQAYERNDLEAVLSLAENIETEQLVEQNLEQAEIESLEKSIKAIEQQIEKLHVDISVLTTSDSYQVLSLYTDTEIYFEEKERELKEQMEELVQSIGSIS